MASRGMDPATALMQTFCALSIVATHGSGSGLCISLQGGAHGRWEIRPLRSEDFAPLMRLEEDVFGANGEKTLGPYYCRLWFEFFTDTCFLAFVEGEPAGYVLCFVRGREAYCTTLAVTPRFQGTRIALRLVRLLISAHLNRRDSRWFQVQEWNRRAHASHPVLS